MWTTLPGVATVTVQAKGTGDGTQARVGGVATCGRATCPACGSGIRLRRAVELGQILRAARAKRGARIWLVTLTLQHSGDDDLGDLLDTASRAWSKVLAGGAAKADRDLGLLGTARGLELTMPAPAGEGDERSWSGTWANGWHPHFHVAVATVGMCTVDVGEMFARWEKRWLNAAPGLPGIAMEWREVEEDEDDEIGYYTTGFGNDHERVALEVARPDGKAKARDAGRITLRGLWDELADAYASREQAPTRWRRAAAMWRRVEAGMSGRRWVVLSNALAELRPTDEELDERMAELLDDPGGEDAEAEWETVAEVGIADWKAINAAGLFVPLLEAAAGRDGPRIEHLVERARRLALARREKRLRQQRCV